MLKKKVLISEYYNEVPKEPSDILQDIGLGSQPSMTPQKVEKSNKVIVLRLTTQNTAVAVVHVFREVFSKHKWIVSVEKESTPDQHYHCIVDPLVTHDNGSTGSHPVLFDLKTWRKVFLEDVFPKFTIPIAHGNKGYSLTWNTGSNIFPYTLKDGKYWYNLYKNDEIQSWKDVSYRKYVKDEFSIELEKIRVQYMQDHRMSIREATEKYIKLKVMFKQTLNMNNIKTFMRGWFYAKNPGDITHLAAHICEDL